MVDLPVAVKRVVNVQHGAAGVPENCVYALFQQAVDEYVKRLSRYCKLDIIELPDEKTPENAGEQLNLAIKAKEGDRILSSLKDDAYVIALAIEGKMLDSV